MSETQDPDLFDQPSSGGSSSEDAPRKRTPRKRVLRKKPDSGSGGEGDVPTSFSASPDDPPARAEDSGERDRGSDDGGKGDSDRPQHVGAGQHSHKAPQGHKGGNQHGGGGHQQGGGGHHGGGGGGGGHHQGGGKFGKKQKFQKKKKGDFGQKKKQPFQKKKRGRSTDFVSGTGFDAGSLPSDEALQSLDSLHALADEHLEGGEEIRMDALFALPMPELLKEAESYGVEQHGAPNRRSLIEGLLKKGFERKQPLKATGVLEIAEEGHGVLVFAHENYKVRPLGVYVPPVFLDKHALQRGHEVEVLIHPPREDSTCPLAVKVLSVMGEDPERVHAVTPFEELIPYYPTERAFLETNPKVPWDDLSMRVVDLLCPLGFGQRGLIVAPPRTGKTMLLQSIANALMKNKPEAYLIVLLVDERPEEVTDFRRQVTQGEVIASTFDESAGSHVHAAEMVIEKARRMVEVGKDVVILLDSITRLARAYNTLMPSSGKILSGGVEASALQRPKRFFGSARNIEDGGSLTILGTALVETGSRMDEVIFEEFKGTGNQEIVLDRGLAEKRVYPAMDLGRSGTRKEELLYHPDEIEKVYSLRRAMKGVPPTEATDMLIQRLKKTPGNIEFLMSMNR